MSDTTFPGLTDRKLKNFIGRLEKMQGEPRYKISQAIEKLGLEWGEGQRLPWHLVEHELYPAETHLEFIFLLGDSFTRARPEVITDFLCRLPDNFSELSENPEGLQWLLREYTLTQDNLLFSAYHRGKDYLLSRVDDLSPAMRRGLKFIQARSGEAITDEERAEILEHLAWAQTNRSGLLSLGGFSEINKDGKAVKPRIASHEDLLGFMKTFGTEEEWLQALTAAAHDYRWKQASVIEPVLRRCSTADFVSLIGGPLDDPADPSCDRDTLSILESRDDDPAELATQALQRFHEVSPPQLRFAEMLALHAAYLFSQQGAEIPEGLDELFTLKFLRNEVPNLLFAARGFAALPRERALAIARAAIEGTYPTQDALLPMAGHFDADLVSTLLEKRANIPTSSPTYLGVLGAPAIPVLEQALQEESSDYRRQLIYDGIVIAMSQEPADSALPVEHETYVDFGQHEGGERSWDFWSAEVFARVLARLSDDRRDALVRERLQAGAHAFRVLDSLKGFPDAACLDDAFAALVADPSTVKYAFLENALRALGDVAVDGICRHLPAPQAQSLLSMPPFQAALTAEQRERLKAAAG